MSILSSITDTILNFQTTQANTAASGAEAAASAGGAGSLLGAAPAQPVDVEAVLTEKMRAKGGPALNWKTSIADLMRLLDLDPSLDNRKELATELGYTGAKDGSAEMNIWLHRQVMAALAANGGVVPAGMAD